MQYINVLYVFCQILTGQQCYPLTKVYPFKKEVDGRVLAAFPIGSFFVDHYYRQRAITVHEHIAKLITSEIDVNVMIIGGNGLLYYKLYLNQFRNVYL